MAKEKPDLVYGTLDMCLDTRDQLFTAVNSLGFMDNRTLATTMAGTPVRMLRPACSSDAPSR